MRYTILQRTRDSNFSVGILYLPAQRIAENDFEGVYYLFIYLLFVKAVFRRRPTHLFGQRIYN